MPQPFMISDDLESGKERRKLPRLEQECGVARATPELALRGREGLVEQHPARGQRALDLGRERAVQEVEHHDGADASAPQWRRGTRLEVEAQALDTLPLGAGMLLQLCEEAPVAIDRQRRNARACGCERVAAASAGQIDERSQSGRVS